jgi:hypothetical protein
MNHTPTRRQRMQVICVFLVIFGAAMFLVSPDPTRAQIIFRLSLMLAGLGGLAWLNGRGKRG